MKMNKEEYERLLKRFALELSEVGVTDELTQLIRDAFGRTPNVAVCNNKEIVERFTYQHNGYMIEAKQTVELTLRKCK